MSELIDITEAWFKTKELADSYADRIINKGGTILRQEIAYDNQSVVLTYYLPKPSQPS